MKKAIGIILSLIVLLVSSPAISMKMEKDDWLGKWTCVSDVGFKSVWEFTLGDQESLEVTVSYPDNEEYSDESYSNSCWRLDPEMFGYSSDVFIPVCGNIMIAPATDENREESDSPVNQVVLMSYGEIPGSFSGAVPCRREP